MNKNIVVIGGSAAGLVSATTAKSNYPDKEVLLIRKENKVMIPCGIPYIFGSLDSSEENIMPDQGLLNAGVELMVNTVVEIKPEEHQVITEDGIKITYEKLIIATGSVPFVPSFIKGTELKNVYTVPKNKEYLDIFKKELSDKNKIAVIGAGFIGVEISDELNKAGKDVTLIEAQSHILGAAFDDETCDIAADILVKHGVTILTETKVSEIMGTDEVEALQFADGTTMEFDAVILSIGYRPNISLAYDSGISCNKQGAIKVDSYMRTHQPDIFACGDCAQKRDFVTGKITPIMLASTATAEARVAGMNLYELHTIKTFNGTIGIYSTNIGNTSFGVAGITERRAQEEGFKIISASFKGIDRHPGKLNDGHYQIVKLVASANTGLIMGGEVVGGSSVGELTNVLGFIVQNKMTISDLLCSQIGTQPMLTASPAKYPMIKAAEIIAKRMMER
jgi:NADPH-dependent 2,4-dienoyl-CoA reductase/sulfur reductase-like enzyme